MARFAAVLLCSLAALLPQVAPAMGDGFLKCNDAGQVDSLRISRTMDFALCRERHGETYCSVRKSP